MKYFFGHCISVTFMSSKIDYFVVQKWELVCFRQPVAHSCGLITKSTIFPWLSPHLCTRPQHICEGLCWRRSVSWLITLRLLWLVGCITDVSSDDLAMGKKMWQTWRLLESDSYHWYTILVFSVILNTILFYIFHFYFHFSYIFSNYVVLPFLLLLKIYRCWSYN